MLVKKQRKTAENVRFPTVLLMLASGGTRTLDLLITNYMTQYIQPIYLTEYSLFCLRVKPVVKPYNYIDIFLFIH